MLDFRAGMVVATIANVNRDSRKRHKPYEPADFFPSLRDTPVSQGKAKDMDMADWLVAWSGGFGANTVVREQ